MTCLSWSEDRVQTLTQLWRDGLSASQVAASLGGVTRNAVIGKIHRLGLSARAEPSRPARAARGPRPSALKVGRLGPPRSTFRPAAPASSAPPPPEDPGLVTRMSDLSAHRCKWPIGDPKREDFSFCGRPADGPYCGAHAAAAVRPGAVKPLERDPWVRRVLAGGPPRRRGSQRW